MTPNEPTRLAPLERLDPDLLEQTPTRAALVAELRGLADATRPTSTQVVPSWRLRLALETAADVLETERNHTP